MLLVAVIIIIKLWYHYFKCLLKKVKKIIVKGGILYFLSHALYEGFWKRQFRLGKSVVLADKCVKSESPFTYSFTVSVTWNLLFDSFSFEWKQRYHS